MSSLVSVYFKKKDLYSVMMRGSFTLKGVMREFNIRKRGILIKYQAEVNFYTFAGFLGVDYYVRIKEITVIQLFVLNFKQT